MICDRIAAAQIPQFIGGCSRTGQAHRDERRRETIQVPAIRVVAHEVALREGVDLVVEEDLDRVGQILVVQDFVALGVDRLALLVDDIVELDDPLPDVEVEAFDTALGGLDRARHEARFDGHVVVEAEALHQTGHAFAGETLHQVVLEGQVEARGPWIALPPGTAAELVVDASGVVPLRAQDVQTTDRHDLRVVLLGDGSGLRQGGFVGLLVHLGRIESAFVEEVGREARRIAAQLDVRAAAGHVRGDRHGAAPTGLGDDA